MDIQSFLIGLQAGKNAGGDTGGDTGGGLLPAGAYWEILDIRRVGSYGQRFVNFNGELFAMYDNYSGSASFVSIHKYSENTGTWTKVSDSPYTTWNNSYSLCCVEHNGKLHFTGGETKVHIVFDGSTLTRLTDLPNYVAYASSFVQNDTLKTYSYYDGKVYAWDEATDTWTEEAVIGSKYEYREFYNVNGTVYSLMQKKLYSYTNGVLTQVNQLSESVKTTFGISIGNCLYLVESKYNYPSRLIKYDAGANQISYVGLITAENASFFVRDGSLACVAFNKDGYITPMKLHAIESTE